MDKQAKTNYKTVKVMETEEVKFNQKMDELAAQTGAGGYLYSNVNQKLIDMQRQINKGEIEATPEYYKMLAEHD